MLSKLNLRRYVKGKAELVEVFAVKPHPSAGGGAGWGEQKRRDA